jgi:hypothetical protein
MKISSPKAINWTLKQYGLSFNFLYKKQILMPRPLFLAQYSCSSILGKAIWLHKEV